MLRHHIIEQINPSSPVPSFEDSKRVFYKLKTVGDEMTPIVFNVESERLEGADPFLVKVCVCLLLFEYIILLYIVIL